MDREALALADRLARRYADRPSTWLLPGVPADDPLAAAADLAAMLVGEEIDAAILRKGAFPVLRVGG